MKFIDSPIPELYNLEEDFEETHNLAAKTPLEGHQARLARIMKQNAPQVQAVRMDRHTLKILSSLGYVAGPQISLKDTFSPEEDVKVLLPYYNQALKASELAREGKVIEGIRILNDIIQEKKNIDVAYTYLTELYQNSGQAERALAVLKQGHDALPSSYTILTHYVHTLIDAEIWNCLGLACWKTGQLEQALEAYEIALSIDDAYVNVLNSLGMVYFAKYLETKDRAAFAKSLETYRRALEIDPTNTLVYVHLGEAYRHSGNLSEAIRVWEKALALNPEDPRILYDLSLAYLEKENREKACTYYARLKSVGASFLRDQECRKLDRLIGKCSQGPG